MTAIPARVAGVREVIAVCPRPDAVVLAAALEAGVDRLFRIGGAHAVAALAYGTATVPRVDKIVGPGNRWVAAAKALVAGGLRDRFLRGPERDPHRLERGRPAWIAADLIAQAEHDPDARALLITHEPTLAKAVADEVAAQMPADGPGARVAARARRHHRDAHARRSDRAGQPHGARAPGRATTSSWRPAVRSAGTIFVGALDRAGRPATTPSDRITCCRPAAPHAFAAG